MNLNFLFSHPWYPRNPRLKSQLVSAHKGVRRARYPERRGAQAPPTLDKSPVSRSQSLPAGWDKKVTQTEDMENGVESLALAATPRSFAFDVADPIRSIRASNFGFRDWRRYGAAPLS